MYPVKRATVPAGDMIQSQKSLFGRTVSKKILNKLSIREPQRLGERGEVSIVTDPRGMGLERPKKTESVEKGEMVKILRVLVSSAIAPH